MADLAAHRRRRDAKAAAEAAGRCLHEELMAEARQLVAAMDWAE